MKTQPAYENQDNYQKEQFLANPYAHNVKS